MISNVNTREMLFAKLKAAPIGSKEQQEALDAAVVSGAPLPAAQGSG